MIKVHLKQEGRVMVVFEQKGEWKIKYYGFVRSPEVKKWTPYKIEKRFSIPVENVLFIEEVIQKEVIQ